MCITSRDTLLVADCENDRLQELQLPTLSFMRFVAERDLTRPQHVQCNDVVVAVSEYYFSVAVLNWPDGDVRARFGTWGEGEGEVTRRCRFCTTVAL